MIKQIIQMTKTKSFTITSEYENVNFIASEIRNFLCDESIDEKLSNEVEICLIEALNNVIKHAYKAEPGNLIDIETVLENDEASVTIVDSGTSRTNTDKATLEFDPDDIDNLPEGGMGLFIIEELMDDTIYKIEGNKNYYTMVKSLQ